MADGKISAQTATTTVADDDMYVIETAAGATKKNTGANLKAAVAPVGATYITQTASSGLSNEQATGALATGILKSTTTTGALTIATGADLPTGIPIASLADPTTGKVIGSSGSAAAAVYPPGYELNYKEVTTSQTTTQTTQASATTFFTADSITFDGSTTIIVSVHFSAQQNSSTTFNILELWEDSTDLCRLNTTGGAAAAIFPCAGQKRLTPTAGAKVYTIRGYVSGASTGSWYASAATGGSHGPGFMRIVKV